MENKLEDRLLMMDEKICALAYIGDDLQPLVCFMGFCIAKDIQLVLHTSIKSTKWKILRAGQGVCVGIGLDFRKDYAQIAGKVKKISYRNKDFRYYESIYLNLHPDSIPYAKRGTAGILIIVPTVIKYYSNNGTDTFVEEYKFF